MENKDYFRARRYFLNNVESENFIYTEDLLKLVDDNHLRQMIINKYSLDVNYKIKSL